MGNKLKVRLTKQMTVNNIAGQTYTLNAGHIGHVLELNPQRGLMVDFGIANSAYPVPPAAIGDWAEIVIDQGEATNA